MSDMPSASAIAFIVEAVPMVLQWPTEGAESSAACNELLAVDLACRELAAHAPDHRAGADEIAFVPAVGAWGRRRARLPGCRPSRPPSGRTEWSCRSRWSAPRHPADSRREFQRGRDKRGLRSRAAVGRLQFSKIGCVGNSIGIPPHRGCVAHALRQIMCTRLHGVRSLPLWAMPMMGLPQRNSSASRRSS